MSDLTKGQVLNLVFKTPKSKSKGGINTKDCLFYTPNLYHSQTRLDKSLHIFSDLRNNNSRQLNLTPDQDTSVNYYYLRDLNFSC